MTCEMTSSPDGGYLVTWSKDPLDFVWCETLQEAENIRDRLVADDPELLELLSK